MYSGCLMQSGSAFGRVVHKNPVIAAGECRVSSGEHVLAPWVNVMAKVGFFPNLNHFLSSK